MLGVNAVSHSLKSAQTFPVTEIGFLQGAPGFDGAGALTRMGIDGIHQAASNALGPSTPVTQLPKQELGL